ncbi:hypothetical protein FPV67DRAFT_747253 [Lyophyllum atratum]|nr:hypothetical protein FPV67DRAFT_747253 [Lyophyllum atratum]
MALLSFILYAGFPGQDLFICTTFIMGKLYSNTLLVTFNNRIALRKGATQGHGSFSHNANQSLGNNMFISTLVNTYRRGEERFDRRGRPRDMESIEIEVMKEIRVHH